MIALAAICSDSRWQAATQPKGEPKKGKHNERRDLIPWSRGDERAPSIYRGGDMDPFLSLHRNVNRLFDEVFRGFDAPSMFGRTMPGNGSWPNVEISENEKEIRVVAEVPGLDEKDIEVLLDDGVLTLRGEKKSETEDKERQFSERYYGRFERRLALGREVEDDNVAATFKNGVLEVKLPKTAKRRPMPNALRSTASKNADLVRPGAHKSRPARQLARDANDPKKYMKLYGNGRPTKNAWRRMGFCQGKRNRSVRWNGRSYRSSEWGL